SHVSVTVPFLRTAAVSGGPNRSALPIGKAPSSKHQAPEQSQTTNPNAASGAGLAPSQAPVTANRSDAARKGCFGAWCLEFLWSLELGAWNFVGFATAAVRGCGKDRPGSYALQTVFGLTVKPAMALRVSTTHSDQSAS